MTMLFVLLVVLGFVFMFLSTWPVQYAARIAWGLWLGASIIWALPQIGGH